MIIYQVLFRILEHICSFFFLLWAMDMLFRCGDRNRRQTLIPFWYLTIVFDVMALLMVPEKHPVLGLRPVVYAVSVYLCVYGGRP